MSNNISRRASSAPLPQTSRHVESISNTNAVKKDTQPFGISAFVARPNEMAEQIIRSTGDQCLSTYTNSMPLFSMISIPQNNTNSSINIAPWSGSMANIHSNSNDIRDEVAGDQTQALGSSGHFPSGMNGVTPESRQHLTHEENNAAMEDTSNTGAQ